MSIDSKNHRIFKSIGMGIFLISLAMLVSTLFLSNYQLKPTDLEGELSGDQVELLSAELEHMYSSEYKSKFAFIRDVSGGIDLVNDQLKLEQKWDMVIYNEAELLFTLTKKSAVGMVVDNLKNWILLTFVLGILGSLMYILLTLKDGPPGIKNNGMWFKSLTSRGVIGLILGSGLILFYIVLYWFPAYIAEWSLLLDPVSFNLSGSAASRWFVYGVFYTLAVVIMGIRFIIKYRHNKYQMWRTGSVMFFQAGFAFAIPQMLSKMNLPSVDLKNIWPLDYSFFFEYRLDEYVANGSIGYFMLGWGLFLTAIGVPLFVYLFGKRWYCSWVCGCGGLAETAGDTFRHQSDNSLKAWKIERYLIHGVLVFAVVMTAAVLYTYFSGESKLLGVNSYAIRQWYGFGIGSVFAGVIGTGFYPLMGNRMWCRFGCPLAAYLGLVQRFKSRFRITTNGGQCISCGNCSTYCEMGIDVKAYAQKGEPIIRSSCVGCGICSAVCPRGVLNLEVKNEKGRFEGYTRPEELDLTKLLQE